ncbi:MAG: serine/threonine-protein kinase [Pseudomonadota bacterium]
MSKDPSVTQRFPQGKVTERYTPKPEEAQVTQRYETASPSAGGVTLSLGELIADCYRVQAGPLGGVTGEADVYHCLDESLDNREVAVKLYRYHSLPKTEVLDQLKGLSHSGIVSLYSYGEWHGRFYEVMEFCHGGVMSDYMPMAEDELRTHLPCLLEGLHYCHQQGIIHRDLKPNNLFFRGIDQKEPLLGDFGISSFLNMEQVKVTQSAGHLTLDYASPELLDGHEVSSKTDYYALGITLVHLLLGHSPYHGLSNSDIIVAHLRGRLDLPNNISQNLEQLLRGLTLNNPETRWGHIQVMSWLRNEYVPLDEENLTECPYPGYPDATTPAALAEHLTEFDAVKQLSRGDIRRWVFDHFNQDMAEEVETLEELSTERPEVALYRLRFLLKPRATLAIGKHRLASLSALVEQLAIAEHDKVLQEQLEHALWHRGIESWIKSNHLAGGRTEVLLRKIRSLCERLRFTKYQGIALFALRYTIDPHTPVELTPKVSVRNPSEFRGAFKQDRKAVTKALRNMLYSKRLDEWLIAAEFDGWEKDIEFIEAARVRYLEQTRLGTYIVRWYFDPDLPFPFDGKLAKTPVELAALIDQNETTRRKGLTLMEQGWIRAWLVGTSRIVSTTALDHALLAINATSDSKLEAVLRLLDPTLLPPKLKVSPPALNFGPVQPDRPKTMQMIVTNVASRGHLNGEITLSHYDRGLTLDKYEIEGNRVVFNVQVEALGRTIGTHQRVLLRIESNGGSAEVPISYRVRPPNEDKGGWWSRLFG